MTRYKHWGIIRLERAIAKELGLVDGDEVECAVSEHHTFEETDEVLFRTVVKAACESLCPPEGQSYKID